jgi:beta-lactamase class A
MIETLIDRRPKRKSRKRFWSLVLTLTIIFLISLLRRHNGAISPVSSITQNGNGNTAHSQKNPDVLSALVKKAIPPAWKNYSVLVVDMGSDFSMGINDEVIYTAASVNKVAILATLYEMAGKGEVDFEKTLTLQADDIQDYGTGSLRYEKPGSTYSIKTLALLMIRQSDNTAAHLLADYVVGMEKIQETIAWWGLEQTDMEENKTSNADMAKLFAKIYLGKVTDPAHTREMLEVLTESDFENRIPALLPKGVKVFHKIGTEVGYIHDVGIVESVDRKYYFGVFTSDRADEEATDKKIAELSKIVFDFMK